MIRKFGTLYAGHVDLDDIGLKGKPVNDRWLTNERLSTVFKKAEAIAQVLESCQYDTFWLAEHHFQREGYECIPNILQLAIHLAGKTKQIRFGCGFNISPMWHPLRLAEDFATADILTEGRVLFGVGRGYHTREVETVGAPMLDKNANRNLFEEQVDIIFKAFNEISFSHSGDYYEIPPKIPYRGYTLEEITLVPRPINLPVDCWQPIVSASERGLDFMTRHGIKAIIGGGAASGGANEQVMRSWRNAQARAGIETELGGNTIIGVSFHIAKTPEEAIQEARPYFEENLKMFAPLGFVRGLSNQQIKAISDPSSRSHSNLPTLEQAVDSGSWLCGPPELIVEGLLDLSKRYPGLEQVNVGNVIGTPQSVIVEQLQWFGEEVIPSFRQYKN